MCPVCFSGGDAVTRETLNAGIGILLGVTVVVLALFARFFLKLARRSRAAAHLVDHALPESPCDVPAETSTGLSAGASAKADGRAA